VAFVSVLLWYGLFGRNQKSNNRPTPFSAPREKQARQKQKYEPEDRDRLRSAVRLDLIKTNSYLRTSQSVLKQSFEVSFLAKKILRAVFASFLISFLILLRRQRLTGPIAYPNL
jgi:hypothetical protein